MKLSPLLIGLGISGFVAADINRDAGARDAKFDFLPKIAPKAIDLIQVTLFEQYAELAFWNYGIKKFAPYHGYPKQTAQVLRDIKVQLEYTIFLTERNIRVNDIKPVQPCKYNFEALKTFGDYITIARFFLNSRIDFTLYFAFALPKIDPLIASVPGASEPAIARWDAFFRIINGFSPSEAFYATPLSKDFAYNLARIFVVPGSCPRLPPGVKTFTPLASIFPDIKGVALPPDFVEPPVITWAWNATAVPGAVPGAKYFIGYHNQVGPPEFFPLNITSPGSGRAQRADDIFGVAYAVLTNTTNATDVDSLTAVTLAGPSVLIGPFK